MGADDSIHVNGPEWTALHEQVRGWFDLAALTGDMGDGEADAAQIAIAWLARGGKRWRPFLTAAVYRACAGPGDAKGTVIRRAALAVECFHKASLIHDDIEDGDVSRDGSTTLHVEYGVPVALNVGDFLLGEGYRLIAECGADSGTVARLLAVAATGHRLLSLGQGDELSWARRPRPPDVEEVLSVFRRKTGAALGVALRIGAVLGGALGDSERVLGRYGDALGVAYQIMDDGDDLSAPVVPGPAIRSSILTALAYAAAEGTRRADLEAAWIARGNEDADRQLYAAAGESSIVQKAHSLFEHHRDEAIHSLALLECAPLRTFLDGALGYILARNAQGHTVLARLLRSSPSAEVQAKATGVPEDGARKPL